MLLNTTSGCAWWVRVWGWSPGQRTLVALPPESLLPSTLIPGFSAGVFCSLSWAFESRTLLKATQKKDKGESKMVRNFCLMPQYRNALFPTAPPHWALKLGKG